MEQKNIKKMSTAYDLLQDLREYDVANVLERKMKKRGYVVKVVRDKYAFVLDKKRKK